MDDKKSDNKSQKGLVLALLAVILLLSITLVVVIANSGLFSKSEPEGETVTKRNVGFIGNATDDLDNVIGEHNSSGSNLFDDVWINAGKQIKGEDISLTGDSSGAAIKNANENSTTKSVIGPTSTTSKDVSSEETTKVTTTSEATTAGIDESKDSEEASRKAAEEAARKAAEEASRAAEEASKAAAEAASRAAAEEASRAAAEEASRKAAEEAADAASKAAEAASRAAAEEASRKAAEEAASKAAAEEASRAAEAATQYIDYKYVYVDPAAYEVLSIVNEERAKVGLDPLTLNLTLCYAANKRCYEAWEVFEKTNALSHTRPDGTSCFTILEEYNLNYSAVGENLALGQRTSSIVMNAWMNSTGHRNNILNSKFKEIGIGYYPEHNVWTQIFYTGW